MKISRVETIPVRLPIKPELAIRSGRGGSHTESPFLLVKIHADDGIVGLGEASCTPRWSGEDQTTAAHFINAYFAPLLIGETVDDVERLTAKYQSAVAGNYFTKAAVEMALWDLVGKARGKPVCELFGPRRREVVPTKWSVSGVEPGKAADIATWAVTQGFTTMKVKVGIDPESDLARVRAVRHAVGAQTRLGVDANGGWRTPQIAIDCIQRLHDKCGIYFAEQPVPAGDPQAMAEVRRHVSVPIIADESVYTLDDAIALARAEAADVFSIYIGKAGGIAPARRIADFAHSAGLQCTIGSNLEMGVASAAMIHLALATPAIDADAYPCDIIGPMFYEDEILSQSLPITGGSARPLERPGLGVSLNDDAVERRRLR
jgi:muconate cycloisomerase